MTRYANSYTTREDDILVRLYADKSNVELAQMLDRPVGSIKGRAKVLGLRKSAARLEERNRAATLAASARRREVHALGICGRMHCFCMGVIPRDRASPVRDAVLAFVRGNPGVTRAQVAQRFGKNANAAGRLLYMLHQLQLIEAKGLGKDTQWRAVENPVPVALPKQVRREPVAPPPSLFAGFGSIFAAAECAA